MQTQAPLAITPQIRKLAARVAEGAQPQFLTVQPFPDTEPSECFDNVQTQIKNSGGSQQLGWNIAVLPRHFAEFEFHAVWRDDKGVLHDITPRPDGETVALFLPDSNATYSGKSIDNIRIPISSSKVVKEFIALADQRFQLTHAKRPVGKSVPYSVEAKPLRDLEKRMANLFTKFYTGPARNDPCPCFSRKKYKQCCGQHL